MNITSFQAVELTLLLPRFVLSTCLKGNTVIIPYNEFDTKLTFIGLGNKLLIKHLELYQLQYRIPLEMSFLI